MMVCDNRKWKGIVSGIPFIKTVMQLTAQETVTCFWTICRIHNTAVSRHLPWGRDKDEGTRRGRLHRKKKGMAALPFGFAVIPLADSRIRPSIEPSLNRCGGFEILHLSGENLFLFSSLGSFCLLLELIHGCRIELLKFTTECDGCSNADCTVAAPVGVCCTKSRGVGEEIIDTLG